MRNRPLITILFRNMKKDTAVVIHMTRTRNCRPRGLLGWRIVENIKGVYCGTVYAELRSLVSQKKCLKQGCSLGLDVSVSRPVFQTSRSRLGQKSKRLGLGA
jgi:hypothetical protein